MKFKKYFDLLFLICCSFSVVDSYGVKISHNGPVVSGANITFVAELFNTYDNKQPNGIFQFNWKDNAMPQNMGVFEGPNIKSIWNVSYPAHKYPAGPYEVQVTVYKSPVFFWSIASQRAEFTITAMLNGKLKLMQNKTDITNGFVSNTLEVNHHIELNSGDLNYLLAKATSISTYWVIDCVYYGQTSDYQYLMNYTAPETSHDVEALIVASYEPITTPAPITTSTTPTTTTTLSTTTSIPTTPTTTKPTTTTPPKTTTTVPPHKKPFELELKPNRIGLPYVCLNSSVIAPDPNKTYGYFHRHMNVQAPITKMKVDGSNWLQPDDVLNLQVSWEGSSLFTYCLKYGAGPYNVTGKEKCNDPSSRLVTSNSTFKIMHYFPVVGNYTILIIISNNVSHVIYPVFINMYEVTPQAQLSVIVVPVVCSFLAVILIVFGVAYYMQSRDRYIVEVADFNFGQAENMEYKTFRERLKEAVQGNGYSCPDFKSGDSTWPSGGNINNYGRMSN